MVKRIIVTVLCVVAIVAVSMWARQAALPPPPTSTKAIGANVVPAPAVIYVMSTINGEPRDCSTAALTRPMYVDWNDYRAEGEKYHNLPSYYGLLVRTYWSVWYDGTGTLNKRVPDRLRCLLVWRDTPRHDPGDAGYDVNDTMGSYINENGVRVKFPVGVDVIFSTTDASEDGIPVTTACSRATHQFWGTDFTPSALLRTLPRDNPSYAGCQNYVKPDYIGGSYLHVTTNSNGTTCTFISPRYDSTAWLAELKAYWAWAGRQTTLQNGVSWVRFGAGVDGEFGNWMKGCNGNWSTNFPDALIYANPGTNNVPGNYLTWPRWAFPTKPVLQAVTYQGFNYLRDIIETAYPAGSEPVGLVMATLKDDNNNTFMAPTYLNASNTPVPYPTSVPPYGGYDQGDAYFNTKGSIQGGIDYSETIRIVFENAFLVSGWDAWQAQQAYPSFLDTVGGMCEPSQILYPSGAVKMGTFFPEDTSNIYFCQTLGPYLGKRPNTVDRVTTVFRDTAYRDTMDGRKYTPDGLTSRTSALNYNGGWQAVSRDTPGSATEKRLGQWSSSVSGGSETLIGQVGNYNVGQRQLNENETPAVWGVTIMPDMVLPGVSIGGEGPGRYSWWNINTNTGAVQAMGVQGGSAEFAVYPQFGAYVYHPFGAVPKVGSCQFEGCLKVNQRPPDAPWWVSQIKMTGDTTGFNFHNRHTRVMYGFTQFQMRADDTYKYRGDITTMAENPAGMAFDVQASVYVPGRGDASPGRSADGDNEGGINYGSGLHLGLTYTRYDGTTVRVTQVISEPAPFVVPAGQGMYDPNEVVPPYNHDYYNPGDHLYYGDFVTVTFHLQDMILVGGLAGGADYIVDSAYPGATACNVTPKPNDCYDKIFHQITVIGGNNTPTVTPVPTKTGTATVTPGGPTATATATPVAPTVTATPPGTAPATATVTRTATPAGTTVATPTATASVPPSLTPGPGLESQLNTLEKRYQSLLDLVNRLLQVLRLFGGIQ